MRPDSATDSTKDQELASLILQLSQQQEQLTKLLDLKKQRSVLLIYFYFLQHRIRQTLRSGSQLQVSHIEKKYEEQLVVFLKGNNEVLSSLSDSIEKALKDKDFVKVGQLSARAQSLKDHEDEERGRIQGEKQAELGELAAESLPRDAREERLKKLGDRQDKTLQAISNVNQTMLILAEAFRGIHGQVGVSMARQIDWMEAVSQPKPVIPRVVPSIYQVVRSSWEVVEKKSQEVRQANRVTEFEVKQVLDHVGKGHLNEVRDMLKKNHALLYATGQFADVRKKIYTDITVLQYAFIAGDIGMCKRILEEFGEDEKVWVAHQINSDVIKRHGELFDLTPTLQAYDTLKTNWDRWDWDERNRHFCMEIGKNQAEWPAWLRYEFAQEGEDAAWCKKTVCGEPKERNDNWYGLNAKNNWYQGYENKYKLAAHGGEYQDNNGNGGDSFAWMRGVGSAVVRGGGGPREKMWALFFLMERLLWRDQECLNIEQSAIQGYRETLEANFRTFLHTGRESASKSLVQHKMSLKG